MKKYYICMVLTVLAVIVLFPGFLAFLITGAGNSVWYGWGVDTAGRGYVGEPTEILSYQNGEVVNSIDIPKCRTYYFTVNEDDQIILSTSLTVYIMDLEGKLISSRPDEGCAVYNKLQWMPDVVNKNGETFILRHAWGRRVIETNSGDVIYTSSTAEAVGYIVSSVVIIAIFLLGAVIILRRIINR